MLTDPVMLVRYVKIPSWMLTSGGVGELIFPNPGDPRDETPTVVVDAHEVAAWVRRNPNATAEESNALAGFGMAASSLLARARGGA